MIVASRDLVRDAQKRRYTVPVPVAIHLDHGGHPWKVSQYAKDRLKDVIKDIIRMADSAGKA